LGGCGGTAHVGNSGSRLKDGDWCNELFLLPHCTHMPILISGAYNLYCHRDLLFRLAEPNFIEECVHYVGPSLQPLMLRDMATARERAVYAARSRGTVGTAPDRLKEGTVTRE
jgi:hypothetical protein